MWQSFFQFANQLIGIFVLISAYMMFFAHTRLNIYNKVRTSGIKTKGIVKEIHLYYKDDNNVSLHHRQAPIVEFANQNGIHRYVSTTYQDPTPYSVGQEVDIWYLKGKSTTEYALMDDIPGETHKQLFRWGLAIFLITFPFLLYKSITTLL